MAATTEASNRSTRAPATRRGGSTAQDSPVAARAQTEVLTRTLYVLIAWVTLLSLGHHVDHLLRGATGWPFGGEVNAFTYSLAIYPAIAAGVLLSRRRIAGPRFWALLSSGGALFVLAVHVGPVAGDSVTAISPQYTAPAAGALALAELGLFIAALLVTGVHDIRVWRRSRHPWSRRRRLLSQAAVGLLALVLAFNTVLVDRETEPAQADAGRIVALPGGDLQVREDEPRNGPPIVLIHGFGGSLHRWQPVVPALARRHRVLRVDLLGHGGSEKPREGYAIEEQARGVSLALRELEVDQAVVAGHSMGGMVAVAWPSEIPAGSAA